MDNNDKPLHLVLREDGKAIEREIIDSRGEHHIIKVEHPDHEMVLSNGAIFDNNVNHIIKGAPNGGSTGINKHTAGTDMRKARLDAAERAVRKAITSESKLEKNVTGGLETIARAQVKLALEGNAYSTNAAKFIWEKGGFSRSDGNNADNMPGNAGLVLSEDVARRLIDAIAARREP